VALFARIFVVLFAFFLACVAGGAVLTFALLPGWTEVIDRYPDQQNFALVVGLLAAFFSVYTMVPAMLIIAAVYSITLLYMLHHYPRLEVVLQTLAVFNGILLAVCLWFRWRTQAEGPQSNVQS